MTRVDEFLGFYTLEDFPFFACPRCLKGKLLIDKSTLREQEPAFSKIYTNNPNHNPMDGQFRFSVQLICKKEGCGEIVNIIGHSVIDLDHTESGESFIRQYYRPKAFYPAPILILMPKKTPVNIFNLIQSASAVAWSDFNAAANRLRVCAEKLLDELGVSREPRDTLDKRIKRLSETSGEHEETLTALRHVGNLGSHGEDVTREVLLKSFELFEYMLEELYGGRKARIKAIAEELIHTKGKGGQYGS